MPKRALRIGITAGDPAGIGPEVALRAARELNDSSLIPIVIGRASALRAMYGTACQGFMTLTAADAGGCRPGTRCLIDVPLDLPGPVPGEGTADTGRESLACIDAAIDLWKAGIIDAIVTGPVSKGNIAKSGVRFTGHTEYLAEKAGGDPFMMMYSETYRVILATTHVPVALVTAGLTRERLVRVMRIGHAAVKALDGGPARIAVAGLDPHCGDQGAIGTFDREVTGPAIADARAAGIDAEGPFAADTLFIPARWGRYNLAVAHYHDQGLIPFKMLAFDEGVNVTLGLPLVRTSVDHGTAYDIAGKGVARWSSMRSAILLAARLAAADGERRDP